MRPLKTVVPLANFFGGLMSSALKFLGRTPPQRTRGLLAVALGLRLTFDPRIPSRRDPEVT